jgi:hypothetical protein
VRLGQVEQLLHRLAPGPTPNHSPRPTAISAWVSWKPPSKGSAHGIHEREQAACMPIGSSNEARRAPSPAPRVPQESPSSAQTRDPPASQTMPSGDHAISSSGAAEVRLRQQQVRSARRPPFRCGLHHAPSGCACKPLTGGARNSRPGKRSGTA